MIQGRFSKGYVFLKPSRFSIPFRFMKISSFIKSVIFFLKSFLFGAFLNSNIRIHILDLLIRTAEIDPFDDSKNRYTVVQYKYDEKRKQIVPTRISASSTLRGAQKLAKTHSEVSGLPLLDNEELLREYVSIRYFSVNEDLERSVLRHRFR